MRLESRPCPMRFITFSLAGAAPGFTDNRCEEDVNLVFAAGTSIKHNRVVPHFPFVGSIAFAWSLEAWTKNVHRGQTASLHAR